MFIIVKVATFYFSILGLIYDLVHHVFIKLFIPVLTTSRIFYWFQRGSLISSIRFQILTTQVLC